MISALLGVLAALFWGCSTLLLRSVARRQISASEIGFWFVVYSALLVSMPAVLIGWGIGLIPAVLAVGAGVATSIGMTLQGRALKITDVSLVAPLISLEGVVASLLGVISGDPLSLIVGLGLIFAALGSLILAGRGGPGAYLAILAGALFGFVLWVTGGAEGSVWMLMMIIYLASALVLAPLLKSKLIPKTLPSSTHLLLAAAALGNIGGMSCYALGARAGSLPAAAVLASQFALPTIIGGILIHKERLKLRQVAGIIALLSGVALVAFGSV